MAPPATLERAVLDALWAAPGGLTAREIADALPGRRRALTTVLTVLDRLRRKGLVDRAAGPVDRGAPVAAAPADPATGRGGASWVALRDREQLAAEAMLDVLAAEPDRGAALARFVNDVPTGDLDTLRSALARRAGGARRPPPAVGAP